VIPKGLIALEELFDHNDVARKPTLQPTEKGVEDVNLGTAEHSKMVKISKTLPLEVKTKYINLLSSFANVFSWDYSGLKTYDTNIIQHTIPIKPNQKPFREKLRRLIPKLLPSIEKEINRLYKSGNIAAFLIGYLIWCLCERKTVRFICALIFEISTKFP